MSAIVPGVTNTPTTTARSSKRISSSLIRAVEQKVIQCYESVYIDIDDGVYITNAPFRVVIDGNNYLSVGQFLGFSAVQEEKVFTTSEVTISLSGMPSHELGTSFISDLLQYDYVDKEVKIYRSFFDHSSYIDSFLMFKGRLDSPVIQDDPLDTTTIAATCSSHWVDYERTNGLITNDDRQQDLYSGDLGFEYAKETIKDIKWKTG
jgi:hypothetical protein